MKKLSLVAFCLFISFTILAQVPQGMSYQAIAFDAGGLPVANNNVGIKASILDNSATGTLIYSESHIRLTNGQGLFNLNIGQGTPLSGIFSSIDWSTNDKYLKVEIDPTGGTNYISAGTTQLMTVPYAFYSENTNSENISALSNISSKNGTMIVAYTSTGGYGFTLSAGGTPGWYSQGFSGTVLGAESTDSAIVVYTTTNVYGFMRSGFGTPGWYSQGISGTPMGVIASGSTGIVVYTSTNTYGFTTTGGGTPGWYSQGISGTPVTGSSSGNLIVVLTTTSTYGFTRSAGGTPGWYSQGITGTPVGVEPK